MARNSLPVFVHHKRNVATVGVELRELSYFQYACEKLSEIEGCLRSQHHVYLTTALRWLLLLSYRRTLSYYMFELLRRRTSTELLDLRCAV